MKCTDKEHDYKTKNTRLSSYHGIKTRERRKVCKSCNKEIFSFEFNETDLHDLFNGRVEVPDNKENKRLKDKLLKASILINELKIALK